MNKTRKNELIKLAYAMVLEPHRYCEFSQLLSLEVEKAVRLRPIKETSRHINQTDTDFDTLIEHCLNALQLFEKQGRKISPHTATIHAVEDCASPVILLRQNGEIHASNKAARTHHQWAKGQKLNGCHFKRLDHRRLLNTLVQLERSETNTTLGIFSVSSHDVDSLHLYALTKVIDLNGASLGRLSPIHLHWIPEAGFQFQQSFDLTDIELRITEAIISGQSLRDLANERGRSLGTLRNQLKNLLAKLEVSSQTELACLYSGYLQLGRGFNNSQIKYEQSFRNQAWRRHAIFTTQDGFKIDYSEVGPSSGRPVLCFSGLFFGAAVCQKSRNELNKRRIRLIMPLRPGFGATSLTANANTEAQDYARYCAELLDHLNIKNVQIMSQHTGVVLAMHAAAFLNERVESVLNVCPVLPLADHSVCEHISQSQRLLYLLAKHLPDLLPFAIRTVLAVCDHGYDEALMLRYFKDSELDLKCLALPGVKAAGREALALSSLQGIDGYVREFKQIVKDWRPLFNRVFVPVCMVTGAKNPEFNSQQMKRILRSAHDGQVRIIEGAALLALHQQPEAVFELLDNVHHESTLQQPELAAQHSTVAAMLHHGPDISHSMIKAAPLAV